MKKSTKIWLIAAAALLAVGLALCVAALASVDFDFAKLSTEGAYETRTYAFDAERLASAEVISVSQDIRIVGSDEKAGTVEYPVGEKSGYEVSFSDGTLLVRHYDHRKWYEHIGLFFSFRDDAVVVYVPTDAVFALTCESTSGSIELSGFAGGRLFAKSTSGSIRITDLAPAALEARSTSGSVEAARLRVAEGDTTLAAVSGSVRLEDAECAARLDMSSTSGGLRLTNVACGGASLRSTSGSVRFTRLRCESLEAKSVSGSIDGGFDRQRGRLPFYRVVDLGQRGGSGRTKRRPRGAAAHDERQHRRADGVREPLKQMEKGTA